MENLKEFRKLSEVIYALKTFNDYLYDVIVGNVFEIEEIGEDSEEHDEKYEEYVKQEIQYKNDISINSVSKGKSLSVTCLVRLGDKKYVDINYLEDGYKIIYKQTGRGNKLMYANTLEEIIETLFSLIDLEGYDMDVKDILNSILMEMEINNLEKKSYSILYDVEELMKLGGEIDVASCSDLHYIITCCESQHSSSCSMSIRNNLGVWLTCQVDYKTKATYRIWRRFTKGEENEHIEKYATIDSAVDVINSLINLEQ